jgi:DUF1009 family protein
MQTEKQLNKVGIIAGGGNLPVQIINALQHKNQEFAIISVIKDSNIEYPANYIDIGNVGQILDYFKSQNVDEIVLAGKITRPSFSTLKLDAKGIKLMAQITKAKFFGDDSLLSIIVKFIENEGFIVKGAEYYTDDLLASVGNLTILHPSEQNLKDIELGKIVAGKIGELDIGQSVIIENGLILGVEAAEGTDNLIMRCASLKYEDNISGVLIKMKKPNQDSRIDLPTIGINTVKNVHFAKLSGIAIDAKQCLIIDKDKVIKLANELGLFITAIN